MHAMLIVILAEKFANQNHINIATHVIFIVMFAMPNAKLKLMYILANAMTLVMNAVHSEL